MTTICLGRGASSLTAAKATEAAGRERKPSQVGRRRGVLDQIVAGYIVEVSLDEAMIESVNRSSAL